MQKSWQRGVLSILGIAALLLMASLFAFGVYLQSARPHEPELSSGYVVPLKVLGVIYVTEREYNIVRGLFFGSFVSIVSASALSRMQGKR